MLGLRLDDPLPLDEVKAAVDEDALAKLVRLGLVEPIEANGAGRLTLTPRGRFLGGGVTAELLA
jgi:hypothetical protein